MIVSCMQERLEPVRTKNFTLSNMKATAESFIIQKKIQKYPGRKISLAAGISKRHVARMAII